MTLKSFLQKHVKHIICVLMLVAAVLTAVTLIQNYSDINRLQVQAAQYNEQLEQKKQDNEKIRAILNSDNQDDYIEQKAREKGYVKDGEVVFYDVSD